MFPDRNPCPLLVWEIMSPEPLTSGSAYVTSLEVNAVQGFRVWGEGSS